MAGRIIGLVCWLCGALCLFGAISVKDDYTLAKYRGAAPLIDPTWVYVSAGVSCIILGVVLWELGNCSVYLKGIAQKMGVVLKEPPISDRPAESPAPVETPGTRENQ